MLSRFTKQFMNTFYIFNFLLSFFFVFIHFLSIICSDFLSMGIVSSQIGGKVSIFVFLVNYRYRNILLGMLFEIIFFYSITCKEYHHFVSE